MYHITLNERVEKIKYDENEINIFIEEYKPFIVATVEKMTGKYVEYGQDDELSIALIAFAEAIKAYNIVKGNFLSFSQYVIKRRIIDYYRKEEKYKNTVSIYASTEYDENNAMDYSISKSIDEYSKEEISEYRRLELEQLDKELNDWGISFSELINVSPKHKRTRLIYLEIIRFIMNSEDILIKVHSKKLLPIAEIEKKLRIPRKTIERGRKYIIAILIILNGDYDFIRDYIKWW